MKRILSNTPQVDVPSRRRHSVNARQQTQQDRVELAERIEQVGQRWANQLRKNYDAGA